MNKFCCLFLSALSFFSIMVFSGQHQKPYQPDYLEGSSQLVNLAYQPHGSCPLRPHQPLHHLVWPLGSNTTSHHQRLPPLPLCLRRLVAHRLVTAHPQPLPLDAYNGMYLVLTSLDVEVEDFCREVCGFHYFTFPTIVGVTVPYAWFGHNGSQCLGMCAYSFASSDYVEEQATTPTIATWKRSEHRTATSGPTAW